jgi:hypothetical protein
MPIGNPLGYKINLPVIGAVGAGGIAIGAILIYYLFLKKPRRIIKEF